MEKHNKPIEADFNPRSLVGSLTFSSPLAFAKGLLCFYEIILQEKKDF